MKKAILLSILILVILSIHLLSYTELIDLQKLVDAKLLTQKLTLIFLLCSIIFLFIPFFTKKLFKAYIPKPSGFI